jgi:hypothetical protein
VPAGWTSVVFPIVTAHGRAQNCGEQAPVCWKTTQYRVGEALHAVNVLVTGGPVMVTVILLTAVVSVVVVTVLVDGVAVVVETDVETDVVVMVVILAPSPTATNRLTEISTPAMAMAAAIAR